MDLDVTGADISGESQLNLSPGSGIDPGRVVRAVPTAAQSVYPETTSELIAPTSITAVPKGAEDKPLVARPGAPVDLSPPEPVQLSKPMKVAQVVPQGSVAPSVQNQFPGEGKGMFGTLKRMDPEYDPNADAMEQERKQMIAKRDIAQRKAAGPMMQILDSEWSKKQADEATAANKRISEIDQQLQTRRTNQQQASNMGLTRGMPATADAAAINEEALREWKEEGNFKAYKGLHGAGLGARADLYTDEAVVALDKKTTSAQQLIDRLGSSSNQVEYNARRSEILSASQDKTHAYASFGITDQNLPKTKVEFDKKQGSISATLTEAKVMVEKFQQKQRELSQYAPISDEKIAKTVVDDKKHSNGEVIPGTTAVTLPNGAKGALSVPNSKDVSNFGTSGPQGWSNASPAQVKTTREQLNSEQEKGAIGQYKMAKSFHEVANNPKMYNSAAGIALLADELGAIGRDVAEGSKAAGSIGLSKMLDDKYGGVEKFLNQATTNYSAYKAWLSSGKKGEEPKLIPRLTDQSIQGFKDVAELKYNQTKKELGRIGGPIETAGRYGIPLDKLGLDETTQGLLKGVHSEALQKSRLDIDKYPFVISGSSRVMLSEDAKVPGMTPAGTYAKELASQIKNTPAETPAVPAPTRGGGGPVGGGPVAPGSAPGSAPVFVPGPSGGPVTGPGYVTYASGIKIGESSNNYTSPPSTKSSASGAYAMIDETWNANKPAGAPDQAYKATKVQQDQAFATLTHKNATSLEKEGVPVNPLTLAMAHQQGAGGGAKLAKAPDGANAIDYVKRDAAANNAPFFWNMDKNSPDYGKVLTVAESKNKFAQHYRLGSGDMATTHEPGTEPKVQPAATAAVPYPNPKNREEALANYNAGQRMSAEEKALSAEMRQKRLESATRSGAHLAPAALGTAGAVIGSAGGPVGSVAGGVGGGAIGGAVENYFTGGAEKQTPAGYGQSMAVGGVKGGVAGIPGMGPAATAGRIGLSGLVGGGEKYLEGGTTPEIVNAAGGSAVGAAVGEAFGQMLGKVGHQIYTRFSSADKAEIQQAAKVLSEQKPKNVLADGTSVENKAYTAAEKTVKEAGIDVEHAAYAHEQTKKQATRGEALTERPGAIEQKKAAQQLENTQNFVGTAGAAQGVMPRSPAAGAPFKPMPGGPVSQVLTGPGGTGKIAAQYMPEAAQAEFMLQKPAANMRERWGNAADARAALLEHERAALKSATPDPVRAKAMRELADNVRDQQEKMVRTLLPQKHADALLQHLKNADTRYRNAMTAGGDDIVSTIAKGGGKSNQAKTAFDALAHDDPAARRMMTAMVNAEQGIIKKYGGLSTAATAAYALAHVPVVGTAAAAVAGTIALYKAKQLVSNYMAMRGAGKQVSFKDLVLKDQTQAKTLARSGGAAIGGAVGGQAAGDLAASP